MLFDRSVSIKFTGAVTVAVFTSDVADVAGSIVPLTVNTAVPFFGTVTRLLRFPEPLGKPLAPPLYNAVHVTLWRSVGNVSATNAPVAVLGPVLATVIVYVSGFPAITVVWPSVFVIDRSP